MKRMIIVLTALLTMTASANAMSYEQAREQALFLTDKMAYELNLTEDQYEAAYEVNLDYLMSINTADDLYGAYWRNRNLDLSYILLDWQYNAFCAASYFYRPLYWTAGVWHFGIYARYPRRNYFYFGRPHFFTSYRGGHSWRMNGGRSWYHGRTFGNAHRNGGFGMRDGFNKGKRPVGGSHHGNGIHRNDGHRNNGTVGNRRPGYDNNRPGTGHRNDRDNNKPNNNNGHNNGTTNNGHGNSSFGGNRANRDFGRGNYTNRQSSTRTTVTRTETGSRPSNFGGNRSTTTTRSTSTPTNRFSPSSHGTPTRSMSSGNSSTRSSMSSGGSSTRSSSSSGMRGGNGGGQRNSGSSSGGHFGGRR